MDPQSKENDTYALKKLVEELTTSGKDKLDEDTFKKVKKICKKHDFYVTVLYGFVTKQLKKKHAEIRFSAFQICDEIFRKSHCFRELVLRDFSNIHDYVLGLNENKPLPKPEPIAKKLKQKAVEAIQQWYDTYSKGYETLRLGYNYLKSCKKVDFDNLSALTEAERQREADERERQEEIKRKKIEKVVNEMDSNATEIEDNVKQFQNCFKLLIPNVNDFLMGIDIDDNEDASGFQGEGDDEKNTVPLEGGFIREDEDDDEDEVDNFQYGSDFMRTHGIMKGVNIQINLEDVRKIHETSDNEVVIQNLKEYVSVLSSKFLPLVKRWEQTIRPYGEGNGPLIKRIIDLKHVVQSALKTFASFRIIPKCPPKPQIGDHDYDSSDDDDDFVEVPFDDPRVVSAAASEAALLANRIPSLRDTGKGCPFTLGVGNSSDPYNQPSTSRESPVVISTSKKSEKELKKTSSLRCPDEYLNEMTFTPTRHENPLAGLSQVWTATPDLHEQNEVQSTGGVLGVATQRVNYERSFEPVKWACRAPLATGRLCPRRDREKCPLHGPIIPRDEAGKPLRPEDAAKELARRKKYEREHPAWQDPQLLAEIKAATGVDLKMPAKNKRKRKYPNLTNIRKTTPRQRLEKKVLSNKALRRVNNALSNECRAAPTGSSIFNFASG